MLTPSSPPRFTPTSPHTQICDFCFDIDSNLCFTNPLWVYCGLSLITRDHTLTEIRLSSQKVSIALRLEWDFVPITYPFHDGICVWLKLVQVLCMLSQSLWLHMYNYPCCVWKVLFPNSHPQPPTLVVFILFLPWWSPSLGGGWVWYWSLTSCCSHLFSHHD